jgi:hypothetical protein
MNFAGAIFCFFFVYLIPVALHFRCLAKTLINDLNNRIFYKKGDSLIESKQSIISSVISQTDHDEMCFHLTQPQKHVSYCLRLTFYGTILVIGLATMVYGLYTSIMTFI